MMFLPPTVSRRMRAKDYPFRRPLIPFVARCSRPKAFVNEHYLAPFEVKLRSSNVIVLSAICINRCEPGIEDGGAEGKYDFPRETWRGRGSYLGARGGFRYLKSFFVDLLYLKRGLCDGTR